ncbi:hypothetical protein LXA43DRAFT_879681 [Ganoderma leucocontextum]|nr:hypothetical protein LXA43DRAFT_879681 [Ganoderma leucocontextum]
MNAATREEVSQYTMLASIEGGTFEDVKFYAFSRRARSGRVDTPRVLFGNSALIRKASSHFDFGTFLTKGFLESGITDMDAPFPSDRQPYTEEYDYASDSDLEDEPPEEMKAVKPPPIYDGPADAELEEGEQSGVQPTEEDAEAPEEKKEKPVTTCDISTHASSPSRQGRVVFIDDFAFRTWRAFIFYAYSGKLSFAPLKSQERARESSKRGPKGLFEPPSCSPKSMYKLAEKYGIESLKEEALEDIKAKLSPHNILAELFSSFTIVHSEIQTMEVEYLQDHIKEQSILDRLPTWFQYLEDGELHPGAASVLASVLVKVVSNTLKPCPYGCRKGMVQAYCTQCCRAY